MIKNRSYTTNDLLNETSNTNSGWRFYKPGMDLNMNDIHIFKIEVSRYYTSIAENYREVLSNDELNRAVRFVRKADIEKYISGKHLVRSVLSGVMDLPANQIEFRSTKNKKPYTNGVEFNLSHSGDFILLAIGPAAIGIDVEYINPNFDFGPVLTNCFNLDEISFIENGDDPRVNFYTMWTRKEAVLKATGEGLVDDLPEVSCLGEIVERGAFTYKLSSFEIENEYIASFATQSTCKT